MLKTSAMATLSVFLATAGQLLLKSGMEKVGYIGLPRLSKPVTLALQIVRTPTILIGLLLFVMSAVIWLIVLSRVPLSFAYPFAGLTYVLITTFSRFALHEQVPGIRWTGILLIVSGIVLVARTAPPEAGG